MKVVYLMSPVRSGSTFLQFLLSNQEDIVGLGEITNVLANFNRETGLQKYPNRCSCGSSPEDCVFWGDLLNQISALEPEDGLQAILNRFQTLFPNKVLLDSSKTDLALKDLYFDKGSVDRGDIRVIFLVRDYRGWSVSVRKHSNNSDRNSLWQTNLFILTYRWFYTTLRQFLWLKQQQIPFLWVHYENLVFDTELQLRRIFQFLELPASREVKMAPDNCHDLYGSYIKNDPTLRNTITYDSNWMAEWRFTLLGILLMLPDYLNRLSMKWSLD